MEGMRRIAMVMAAVLLAGCGDSDLSVRYRAERDLWKARRMGVRIQSQPDAAGPLVEKAIEAYAKVLEEYPSSRVNDPEEAKQVAAIRAAAALGLSRLHVSARGDWRGASEVLFANRLTAPDNLDATMRIHAELLRLLQETGSSDTLVLVLEGMLDTLPPADEEGHPVALVLDAPLQIVEIEESLGHAEEAAARLEVAQIYLEEVRRDYAGKPVAVAARLHQANVLVKQGRYEEADDQLAEAARMPRSEEYIPGILLTRATVRQQGLDDQAGAIELLTRLHREFPDDPRAPGALLQIGIAYQAAGRPDSALVAFDRVEDLYPAKVDVISQAQLLAGNVVEVQGKWDEALSRYRAVSARFPRTTSGLLAPLQIAAHYEKMGDEAATEATLLEAVDEYERIARELSGDPASREIVLAALDHLADAWSRLGRWEDAVRVLLARAEDFPADYRSPLAFVRAASIQEERLHDPRAAVATLERLAERYPDLPLTRRAEEKIKLLQGS
jgi:tetratricopeptide (TPR) repeat protein